MKIPLSSPGRLCLAGIYLLLALAVGFPGAVQAADVLAAWTAPAVQASIGELFIFPEP